MSVEEKLNEWEYASNGIYIREAPAAAMNAANDRIRRLIQMVRIYRKHIEKLESYGNEALAEVAKELE